MTGGETKVWTLEWFTDKFKNHSDFNKEEQKKCLTYSEKNIYTT